MNQGHGEFDVLISKTGEVGQIHLVSGNPLLVPAAMEAVKQSRYAPTRLNGEPVEVKTTVAIPFTLEQISLSVARRLSSSVSTTLSYF